jgi:NAD(P)-dependent dehydrogenase (short-subunit alcohol dehydrogenase family)
VISQADLDQLLATIQAEKGQSEVLFTNARGGEFAALGGTAFSVYSASKSVLSSFARTWTADLKDRKIRINAISPGPIDTPGLGSLAAEAAQAEQIKNYLASTVPLGRLGTPDEIEKALVFLASDDSSFVMGTELFVDAPT